MATATQKPPTKSEIVSTAAEQTGLSRRQVSAVLESVSSQIRKNVGRRGPGSFTVHWNRSASHHRPRSASSLERDPSHDL